MATITSPSRPWVMNCLVPSMIQWAPSRTAAVRIDAASLPDEASVRPHAASCSPRASGTR
jgi:hypothetical protein